MSIRLTIDYRLCRSSGIGVYLRTLVRALVDRHQDFRITLLGGDEVPGIVDHIPCNSPIYTISELLEVPLRAPRHTDIFWSPNYNAPFASPGRLVVTVHDVNHLALPYLLDSGLKRSYARMMFRNVRRRASRVITVSRFTASELTRLAGVPADRITVIHSGIGVEWQERSDPPRPIAQPYVLFVGNVKPHKNLVRLLKAFAGLVDRTPHRLVIVGKREGFITPDREALTETRSLGDRVVFAGEAPAETLRAYYRHADLLVYPSLYEGFGFPPLEAMSVGTPVAASRAASIPEICGDAVAYFDPLSVDEMTTVIWEALTNTALRERLRASGRAQLEKYSWPRAADEIARVFREVAGAA